MMYRCQRQIWKKAGKGINGFPLTSNSRHLRASRNASMHESGSVQLTTMAPEILNHREETNKQYYQTFNRGKMVAAAKRTFFEQCTSKRTPENETSDPGVRQDCPDAPKSTTLEGEPRKGMRARRKPKFITDNFFVSM